MHVHNNDKMRQLLIQTCALILIIGVVFAKKRAVVLMDSESKSSGAIYTKDTIILNINLIADLPCSYPLVTL